MTAGGFHAPVFTVAWPTGEFGAHGPGRRGEAGLPQGAGGGARRRRSARRCIDKLVAQQYENGQAMNMAATLEIDAVIDPAETRAWLVRGLASASRPPAAAARYVDTW